VNVGDCLRFDACNFPNKEALICGDKRLTYRRLNERVNSLANGLRKLGVKKGSKISIFLQNGTEYIEIYYALAKLGAVAVPLNFMLKGRGLEFLINGSDSRFSFVEEETRRELELVRDKLIHMNPDGYVFVGKKVPRGYVHYEELATTHATHEPGVEVREDDDIIILYSSGTTGLPKGIVLTHKTRLTYFQWCGLEYSMGFEDVHLIITPLYHNVACFLSQTQFYTGGKVVVLPRFDARETLATIEREKVTTAFMVPTQFNVILDMPDKDSFDVSSIKYLITGAAPLSTRTKEQIIDLFGCGLHEMYGLTETGLITNMKPKDALRKVRCVGQPFFHMELQVVDDKGRPVHEGEVGEIVGRGPLLLRTYYNNEEIYNTSMRDGWFYSGDLGRVDEEGFLYLVDRKKDMICSGGVNIYPMDIEEALHSHPKIRESAVIGVPHPKWGEAIKAIVVVKQGEALMEKEVIAHCRHHLGGYQVPKSVEFVAMLPRNPSGKVLKRELRAPYWEGLERNI
jgi:acyl-CoA synthetase (AMP-forming)/AMP-acid ligase II